MPSNLDDIASHWAAMLKNSQWLKRQLAEAWDEGWYDATNGKWGLPEEGANPYRESA